MFIKFAGRKQRKKRMALPTGAASPEGGGCSLQMASTAAQEPLPGLRSQVKPKQPFGRLCPGHCDSDVPSPEHIWLWLAAHTDTTVLAFVVSFSPLSVLKVVSLSWPDSGWSPVHALCLTASTPWQKSE
jgi:hypothetical protein